MMDKRANNAINVNRESLPSRYLDPTLDFH